MAFSDLELQTIKNIVGTFCQRRSPPQFKNELRVVYEVQGHSVSIFEERPHWRSPGEWTHTAVAKFRYVRSKGTWNLYWMRRDLKWHAYDPETSRRDLQTLVSVVDQDKYGAFFG
jgi:hypothetical protein